MPGPPGAYRSGPAECGAPGRGVPSWAGWRARGLCAPARPRSAPLASSVTMDISRLRRPLLALGDTAGRQLHWRPGDQLGGGSRSGKSHGHY